MLSGIFQKRPEAARIPINLRVITMIATPAQAQQAWTLQKGSGGDKVAELQLMLIMQGKLSMGGNPLGYFDDLTLAAVNKYKDEAGLWNFDEFQGVVGQTTWDHILNSWMGGFCFRNVCIGNRILLDKVPLFYSKWGD